MCQVLVAAHRLFQLWNMESKFPDQGSNLGPQHWKHGVLATGLLRKSPILSSSISFSLAWF